ncbi:hypothetical protein ID0084_08710 [Helicobacter pylori]
MDNRDGHAVITNVIKSLETGDPFGPMDRSKFAQAARAHGIKESVIEEVIDICQTLHLVYHYEDRLDGSDLARKEKKAVRTELQKSIDENLGALRACANFQRFVDMGLIWDFPFHPLTKFFKKNINI